MAGRIPSTVTGGNWLSVSPTTGVAPSTVTVTVSSATLAKGAYQGSLIIQASSGSNATNSPQIVQVALAIDAPVAPANGIVNGASFSKDAVNSPGSIVSLFGTNLASGTASNAGLPLPTNLLGTQVLVSGKYFAPLFYVSPTQINFQMPTEAAGNPVSLVVISSGVTSLAAAVKMAPEIPGIFTATPGGTGQAAALNQDNSPNSAQNPAAAGSVIQIFATGLGVTNPAAATGQAGASSLPLNQTVSTPVVTIANQPATVSFSGLAPGFVGLYQVNAQVPAGLSGNVSLQIQINEQSSNTATIAVR